MKFFWILSTERYVIKSKHRPMPENMENVSTPKELNIETRDADWLYSNCMSYDWKYFNIQNRIHVSPTILRRASHSSLDIKNVEAKGTVDPIFKVLRVMSSSWKKQFEAVFGHEGRARVIESLETHWWVPTLFLIFQFFCERKRQDLPVPQDRNSGFWAEGELLAMPQVTPPQSKI